MQKLPIHDDLYKDCEIIAHEYSCPIFIVREFGVALAGQDKLLGNGSHPDIRSGTLTFISIDGAVYGLTCRHVVEVLETEEASQREKYRQNLNFEPPEPIFGFFFPKGNTQIHINSKFYCAESDFFTKHHPDVAIAKIHSEKLSFIGRQAIPINGFLDHTLLNSQNFTCIAQGYPELSRSMREPNTLSISSVTALAPCAQISEKSFTMHAELRDFPNTKNSNLSGMSGGPVLWCTEDSWGILGIVKQGSDLIPDPSSSMSISSGPTIWIEGVPLTPDFIRDLVKRIPDDDAPLRDKTKEITGG